MDLFSVPNGTFPSSNFSFLVVAIESTVTISHDLGSKVVVAVEEIFAVDDAIGEILVYFVTTVFVFLNE